MSAETSSKKGFPFKRLLIVLVLVVAGAAFAIHTYFHGLAYQSTENAALEADVVQIAPRINGTVARVLAKENQLVKKGDLLVELDPTDYQLRVDQARVNLKTLQQRYAAQQLRVNLQRATTGATLEGAQAQLGVADANIARAQAGVESARQQRESSQARAQESQAAIETARRKVAEADAHTRTLQVELLRSRREMLRYQRLFAEQAISRQQLENYQAKARANQAEYDAAFSRARSLVSEVQEHERAYSSALQTVEQAGSLIQEAQSQVSQAEAQKGDYVARLHAAEAGGTQVQISQSEAQVSQIDIESARQALKQAELNLSYTRVFAPWDGTVARKSVEVGAYYQPGQAMLAVVSDRLWVVANFKETQLTRMRVGQKAEVRVDVASRTVLQGHIESLQAGTGSRFSLLPPENASGNWVKVVQRVPVKIVFDTPPEKGLLLAPGMSAVVEVSTQ